MVDEVPIRPLFDLGRSVANAHDVGPRGKISVLPVLTDGHERTLPILRALAQATGGVILDAEQDEFASPVMGSDPSPELVVALETALSVTSGPVARTLRVIDGVGGGRDATFEGGPSAAAASEGEKRILGLARALLDPRLATSSFAVVAYREFGMDPKLRQAAWSLIVDQLPLVTLGPLRSLVVVVDTGGWIDVGLQCQPARGFRYALSESRLLRRNSEGDYISRASQLSSGSQRLTVLFLGAGFSASSRLPMGNALRDESIKKVLGRTDLDADISSERLAELFYDLFKDRLGEPESSMTVDRFVKLLTLERVVQEEKRMYPDLPTLRNFADLEGAKLASPGPSVRALHRMLLSKKRLVVVTVNLDRLVEHAHPERVRVFATEEDFKSAESYVSDYVAGADLPVPVLKVHGTISDLDSCVVTDDATRLGISGPKRAAISKLIHAGPETVPWVYVGASMRDLDLQPIFKSPDFIERTNEYWVAPYLVDTVEEFALTRAAQWRAKGIAPTLQDHLITETADVFLEALADRWPSV